MVIGDLKNYQLPGKLVINGFIGFENSILENKFGAKSLLGPKYQILKKQFSKKIKHKPKYSLIATFGGFDEKKILEKFLQILKEFLNEINVKIILGPATTKSKIIKNLEKEYKNKLKIIQSTNNMAKEIASSKFGICSGGITTYEFASMKIPFAIISQVPHQLNTAKEWEKRHVAINLGLINKISTNKLRAFLVDIVNDKIKVKNKKKIIDGNGAKRVAREIKRLI